MSADVIAAIDLGSNSFHMLISRITDGQLRVVDRYREMVQLATGLDERNNLDKSVQNRALACLARFGQRLRDIPPSRVRIVGTNTLRKARNSGVFLARAEAILGHPVEIISGIEEARLIYLGVAHSTATGSGKRLVIDIGGGSTELIIGEDFKPLHLESLYMGCVSHSRSYFADGRITEKRLRAAELAVRMELEPVAAAYRNIGWGQAIGASGTIKAVRDIVAIKEGWCDDGITLEALDKLRVALLETGRAAALTERWSLETARAQVITGGFVVLHALCERLGIERMRVSDGALREGVIYDLVGRILHEDARDHTIAVLTRRYGLEQAQAERVATTARELLRQISEPWRLEDEQSAHDLQWAAQLHEIGLAFAHNQYHKHGAYVVRHSDLPGFSRSEQALIAVLVRGHRRKFPSAVFQTLPKPAARATRRLCILLRIAVLLHRSRNQQPTPTPRIQVEGKHIRLGFPPGWLDGHPLTRADLVQEAAYLTAAKFKLDFD